ncbi:MAG: hypothetical protein RML94_00200 [Bacteroidia bacterium]|nr:hypothetical protein [Bacteroidia bacterium]
MNIAKDIVNKIKPFKMLFGQKVLCIKDPLMRAYIPNYSSYKNCVVRDSDFKYIRKGVDQKEVFLPFCGDVETDLEDEKKGLDSSGEVEVNLCEILALHSGYIECKDEANLHMHKIHQEIKKGYTLQVSTDGYILMVKRIRNFNKSVEYVIDIPNNAIKLLKLLSERDPAYPPYKKVRMNPEKKYIYTGEVYIWLQENRSFPNYEVVIPQEESTDELVISAGMLPFKKGVAIFGSNKIAYFEDGESKMVKRYPGFCKESGEVKVAVFKTEILLEMLKQAKGTPHLKIKLFGDKKVALVDTIYPEIFYVCMQYTDENALAKVRSLEGQEGIKGNTVSGHE